jgi:hypothetical protein
LDHPAYAEMKQYLKHDEKHKDWENVEMKWISHHNPDLVRLGPLRTAPSPPRASLLTRFAAALERRSSSTTTDRRRSASTCRASPPPSSSP